MGNSAPYVAAKRRRAREAGLCITCCKKQPDDGRTVCKPCRDEATRRSVQRRKKLRLAAKSHQIVEGHERAGDTARAHHLYEDAAQHYQDALAGVTIPVDQSRIAEKLAYALSLGDNPEAASPLFARTLASHIDTPGEAAKTIETLLQQARQLYIDARTESALPVLAQAIRIAEGSHDSQLYKLTNSRMANYLLGLSRFQEAAAFLRAVGEMTPNDTAPIRTTFCMQKGIIAAAFGNLEEAFDYFEQAASAAKEDPDVFHVTNVWCTYGFWAAELGALERAKACQERALLVARQHHVLWRIPHLCLEYADILARMGQYGRAYEYLLNALAYSAHASKLDTLFAEVGIPLALYMKDKAALAQCARVATIDLAFRSGQPVLIGSVAAAFAQSYAESGQKHEVQALLHRALDVLCNVEQSDRVWAFPIAVARFGCATDIPKARELILLRAKCPCADVAYACLDLFDAFVAQRHGQQTEVQYHAMNATRRFEALGWHGYADLGRNLLPRAVKGQNSRVAVGKPFADLLPILTMREQQVAELVLTGMTNRAIADRLSIKERTVESHMTSIMSHLGVRSRHQLVDHLTQVQV